MMPKAPDQIKFHGAHYIRADIYSPSKGDTEISTDGLLEIDMSLDPADVAGLASQLSDINAASKNGSNIPESVAYKLATEANDVLQGFGVESLPSNPGDMDTPAIYVNRGDMYNGTIVWDFNDQLFYLTTPGDWLAVWEQKQTEGGQQSGHTSY